MTVRRVRGTKKPEVDVEPRTSSEACKIIGGALVGTAVLGMLTDRTCVQGVDRLTCTRGNTNSTGREVLKLMHTWVAEPLVSEFGGQNW